MKKTPAQTLPETQNESKTQQQAILRGCASRHIPGGEKSQAQPWVGWGFSASVLFSVKQPSEKAPEEAERAHKSQQPSGASCPTSRS